MAISNHERVGRSLGLLLEGLYPFVEREMKAVYRDRWLSAAAACLPDDVSLKRKPDKILQEDISCLLAVIWEQWNNVFKKILGHAERSLISELRTTRNTWAHKTTFSTDDAYRAVDSITRLLTAISAAEAEEVEKQKQEILRSRFQEQARKESRKVAVSPVEGTPISGFKPWREVVTPHQDVASGRYQQAEFAADLWQVFLDEGSDEYRLPSEFFRRTFLTEGLKQLLVNALLRLGNNAGDPVIELQTNFGGGKTHAMLALYHLFLGVPPQNLPGIEPVLETAKTHPPSQVNTVVLVGNKISPGQPQHKKDGTVVKTLWGELAWQLGGREAYEMIRESDETSTNPGDTLRLLLNRYSPCLILIDEWVAYARQLHQENDLPGGSFDTHFTFAQTLSESAKNADRALLIVSIPSSDIEIGGDRGKEALDRLKNAIGRVESPWRPASAEESFEIVRRRLFQPITDPNLFVARDAVVKAFGDMYQTQAAEYPIECREASYRRRLGDAYPIHPELFDRLYSDWSTLDKFQRTRGVLRLMAKVIQTLWERQDQSLLILPAHVAIDDSQIQSELTRYLDDNWVPVLEKDIDGAYSLPMQLDRENPNLGRYSACRRVTRTLYLGSAPTLRAANRGLEERRIKLGCVQPGESAATFGDALRRLTDRATYLYVDGKRYWFSTQPSVNRLATERAEQLLQDTDRIHEEISKRIKADKSQGEFVKVHPCPISSADVTDEMTARLVILNPDYPHTSKTTDSPARQEASNILENRGSSPRYCKNMLVFLAPDNNRLNELKLGVSQFLAWSSIVKEKSTLNLDEFQRNQAESKCKDANETVESRLKETYIWLLVPFQSDPQGKIEWQEFKLQGTDALAIRASRKLIHEEHLITQFAPSRLKMEALDPYLWRDANHLDLKKLWEYLAYYLYLPRLKNQQVLVKTVEEGIAQLLWQENFAYAEGWDETKQRYRGLKAGEHITAAIASQNLLVKPEIALRQREADNATIQTASAAGKAATAPRARESGGAMGYAADASTAAPAIPAQPRRFYGTVKLDALRLRRDAGQIADEVLQHLTSLVGAEVEIALEIQVRVPDGVPDNVIRTVTENCRVLKFETQEFETE